MAFKIQDRIAVSGLLHMISSAMAGIAAEFEIDSMLRFTGLDLTRNLPN